ncbi:MAG: S-adenosylmethionine:tRNA ribosyltransferase-isomerase, partial [Muribaculaceae bacterium]|nr:S-adenosylmethionine:tRNA ribosyltransferase-isomerase [Muribaculaceae bacterium]
STRIIIAPGYRYRIVKGMVTNFHQPQSTLLLLVSAFVDGKWREIYDYALANDFRFLSYGDACLFLS